MIDSKRVVATKRSRARKTIILAVMVGLVTGMLFGPAEAKKKKRRPAKVERVVEASYQCPCGISAGVRVDQLFFGLGGAIVKTERGDRFVEVALADDIGDTVFAILTQTLQGQVDDVGEVCGSSDKALKLPRPGEYLYVFVYDGTCSDRTTLSIATSGIITLTFSNLR